MSKLTRKITGMFELPREITLNLPLITITGSEQVSVENLKGVIEYTSERIRMNTSCGVIKVVGKGLLLKQITSENVLVTGTVTGLEYLM